MRAVALLALAAVAAATVHLDEKFHAGWEDNWVQSTHKGADAGEFKWSAGKFYADAEEDKGIQTSQDAKFYGLSAKFESFSNEGKKLIIQFTVKHEQNIDCGGGYVKVFPSGLDQADMHGESPYNIMFGPDICGPGTRKVHVIFAYKGENHLVKKTIPCKADEATHLYTLVVSPDNTYEVRIDGEKVESGSLYEDFDMLPPKKINDPSVSKPSDWIDEEMMDDPSDSKPEDWDKPEMITDPEAAKPEDWDDEFDGEWEAPMIPNPEFKGEWRPKRIVNPEYKGPWVHPQIDNPEYTHDDALYKYDDFGAIGFDLWQVKSGTIFDNVLITDDEDEAAKGVELFKTRKEGEEKMKKEAEEKERAQREAEEAAAKAAEEAAKPAADDETVDEEEAEKHDEL